VPAGLVVTGALAFQTNGTAIAASQAFLIGTAPLLNTFLYNYSGRPGVLAESDPAGLFQEKLGSLIWDSATGQIDWLETWGRYQTVESSSDLWPSSQQGTDENAGPDHGAVLETLFAQMANTLDDFDEFKMG